MQRSLDAIDVNITLVLCSVDRTAEIVRFLDSLVRQGQPSVEVVLVDQNDDGRLDPIVDSFADRVVIRHLRSARGLSRARNVGLRAGTGEIVAFPDDDCWYPDGLLDRVVNAFESDSTLDGVTGRFTNEHGEEEGRWLKEDADLNPYNVWRGAISFSIFLKRRVVQRVGDFNETLGVGAGTPWGASEETDYLLRSIKAGFRIGYLRALVLGHPVKAGRFDANARIRHKKYEAGIGHVIRLHDYPIWYFPMTCARTACGVLIAMGSGDLARAHFKTSALMGRISGWSHLSAR